MMAVLGFEQLLFLWLLLMLLDAATEYSTHTFLRL